MEFKPFDKFIYGKKIIKEEVTDAGIIKPDTVESDTMEVKIVGVSPGWFHESGKFMEPRVKVGDHVLISKNHKSLLNGLEEVIVLTEDSIVGHKAS